MTWITIMRESLEVLIDIIAGTDDACVNCPLYQEVCDGDKKRCRNKLIEYYIGE